MFSDPVAATLAHALFWISRPARTVVDSIVEQRGFAGLTDCLARRIGVANRHLLNRVLRADGLPSCTKLSAWIRILFWVSEFESSGASLTQQALSAGRDPAVYFRTVRRVTGCDWRVVRYRGSDWVLLELLGQCRIPWTETSVVSAS